MTEQWSFDAIAEGYDAWYDDAYGSSILQCEVECLRPLLTEHTTQSVEVGVGTGRFAHALGIPHGVDPSLPMLRVASKRGIQAVRGVGEALPFRDQVFRAILLATTLEFVANAEAVFLESHRALRVYGRLVVGLINRDSAWGHRYREEGERGDPVFSRARFWTTSEVAALGERTGFEVSSVRSTLLGVPGEVAKLQVTDGDVPGAGFVAVAFRKHSK